MICHARNASVSSCCQSADWRSEVQWRIHDVQRMSGWLMHCVSRPHDSKAVEPWPSRGKRVAARLSTGKEVAAWLSVSKGSGCLAVYQQKKVAAGLSVTKGSGYSAVCHQGGSGCSVVSEGCWLVWQYVLQLLGLIISFRTPCVTLTFG